MTSDDSSSPVDEITLSSGVRLFSSWTPVEVVGSVRRLHTFRRALRNVCSEMDRDPPVVTRESLNRWLRKRTDESAMSVNEFNAIMAGLEECDVATERETRGATYANSEFYVEQPSASEVIDQWLIAARYAEVRSDRSPERTITQLVATLPPDAPAWLSNRVDHTDLGLRHLAVQAKESLRIAAPYLDPEEAILEDIAALPSRGVSVRLLTREATGEDADKGQRKSLERLAAKVPTAEKEAFVARDLYSTDCFGRQRAAVHAKVVIVDEERAYIGSANFTQTGLDSNFELGVLVEGPLAHDVTTVFDEIFQIADRIRT